MYLGYSKFTALTSKTEDLPLLWRLRLTGKIMTEKEYLAYCQSQIAGPLKEEDLITMLTAWGTLNYSLGYKTALADHKIKISAESQSETKGSA